MIGKEKKRLRKGQESFYKQSKQQGRMTRKNIYKELRRAIRNKRRKNTRKTLIEAKKMRYGRAKNHY